MSLRDDFGSNAGTSRSYSGSGAGTANGGVGGGGGSKTGLTTGNVMRGTSAAGLAGGRAMGYGMTPAQARANALAAMRPPGLLGPPRPTARPVPVAAPPPPQIQPPVPAMVYDPLSSIQAPTVTPAYDPLSSIQAPAVPQVSAPTTGLLGATPPEATSYPISTTTAAGTGYYHSFQPSLPTQDAVDGPNKFDNTIYQSNLVNSNGVPMEHWSNGYDPNKLSDGAQKIHQAIADASLRANQPVDYFSGKAARSAGTKQHPLGQAIDVRLNDPVTGKPVGYDAIGKRAYNPIGNLVNGVRQDIQALAKPYADFAKNVIGSFKSNPGTYGAFNNQRWGGAFGGKWGKDYMHYDEGRVASGVSPAQSSFRNAAFNGSIQPAGGPPPGVNYSDTSQAWNTSPSRLATSFGRR